METTGKKLNPITWLVRYLWEAKGEMRKVTWPSKQETIKYSVIIIVLSLVIAAFFGGFDWLLNKGLEKLVEFTAR